MKVIAKVTTRGTFECKDTDYFDSDRIREYIAKLMTPMAIDSRMNDLTPPYVEIMHIFEPDDSKEGLP